jgi:hypothetical protein
MNIKISKEQHIKLCGYNYSEYIFGSQLHGIANNDSDFDYVRVISDDFYNNFITLAKYLPNIHSFQYDDVEKNSQYVWTTEKQFYHNLFSGDGNMIADIVILSGEWNDALFLTRTYKVIKGYLGVAKRDLKLHGTNPKKQFHALRSLYMAKTLMHNRLPTVDDIIELKNNSGDLNKDDLWNEEQDLRNKLNDMLNNGEIDLFPKFDEKDDLVLTMINSNNIREFKY